MDIARQNVSTIASTQDHMLAQPEAYSTHYVPSVVSTTTGTTPSGLAHSATDQHLNKIESMFPNRSCNSKTGTKKAVVSPVGTPAVHTRSGEMVIPTERGDGENTGATHVELT
uniref:Uncharacterized protein n=1 Tax=Pseudo-nitzschia australis TaxID=44445 RepID=A0A7S4ASS2_9STRA